MATATLDSVRLGKPAGDARRPRPGLVLDWRRHSYRWTALVVTVQLESGARVVQEWVPAERLRPVRSDPNSRSLY